MSDNAAAPIVLIVDDDEAITEMLNFALEDSGFQVVVVARGDEAVTMAQRVKPAVILMDLQLIGMSGEEATQMLKKNPETAAIPVILCTASRRGEVAADETGADGILLKPFSLDTLHDVLQKAVATSASPTPSRADKGLP